MCECVDIEGMGMWVLGEWGMGTSQNLWLPAALTHPKAPLLVSYFLACSIWSLVEMLQRVSSQLPLEPGNSDFFV